MTRSLSVAPPLLLRVRLGCSMWRRAPGRVQHSVGSAGSRVRQRTTGSGRGEGSTLATESGRNQPGPTRKTPAADSRPLMHTRLHIEPIAIILFNKISRKAQATTPSSSLCCFVPRADDRRTASQVRLRSQTCPAGTTESLLGATEMTLVARMRLASQPIRLAS
jgi:hypothetical protein